MFGLVEMDTAKHGTIRYDIPFGKTLNTRDSGLWSSDIPSSSSRVHFPLLRSGLANFNLQEGHTICKDSSEGRTYIYIC
jgi:hypothetical protein